MSTITAWAKQSERGRWQTEIKKEITIHRNLSHHNIIRFLDVFSNDENVYIVLEYATSGELFDRIAPDIGVGEELAHFYFKQLIAGMEYLHANGVAHRDLKPENLLLDDRGNLKISDFGLATVFIQGGKERILYTACGTPPYAAPEIQIQEYRGHQVDIWSSGIILYTLLVGNTPWGEPTVADPEYSNYVNMIPRGLPYEPWNMFSRELFDLVTGIINPSPGDRYTVKMIKQSAWFVERHCTTIGQCNDPVGLATKMMNKLQESGDFIEQISFSQPETIRVNGYSQSQLYGDQNRFESFSQPQPSRGDTMLSQSQSMVSNCCVQPLEILTVRQPSSFCDLLPSAANMRFYSNEDLSVIVRAVTLLMQEFAVQFKVHPSGTRISFSTVDKRRCPMNGEVRIQKLGEASNLATFKKSKGDPLEFKRFFKGLYGRMVAYISVYQ
ncbi:kinase-like domain-containing protein [Cladochytrium replicatum]|nr:kinase-like domain-containing protein [Cladochytrium replicatum]